MTLPNGFNTHFFLVFLHNRTTKKPRHILIKTNTTPPIIPTMFPGESGEDFDRLFPLLGPMVGTRPRNDEGSGCVSSVLESSVGAEDEENFLCVSCTKTSAYVLGMGLVAMMLASQVEFAL